MKGHWIVVCVGVLFALFYFTLYGSSEPLGFLDSISK